MRDVMIFYDRSRHQLGEKRHIQRQVQQISLRFVLLAVGVDQIRDDLVTNKKIGTIVAVTKDSFIILTGDGYLQVFEVQLEGKKRMPVKDFLLGYKLEVGTKLG